MVSAAARIVFSGEGVPDSHFEETVVFNAPRNAEGEGYVAITLFAELNKEALWERFIPDLPEVEAFVRAVKQSFTAEEMFTTAYEDRLNSRAMWFEIGNNLLRTRFHLAQSRAYKELENARNSEMERFNIHGEKMANFDLAVILLAKVGDLLLRLLFENLGASIVTIDRGDPDWERLITWKNVRHSLQNRSANPELAKLSDDEYSQLMVIIDEFRRPSYVEHFVRYRNRLAHRLTPSVDYPELYTFLESREWVPIRDESGEIRGRSRSFGGLCKKAEYDFLSIYTDTVETFRHYVVMLSKLEAIPRFSLEARG